MPVGSVSNWETRLLSLSFDLFEGREYSSSLCSRNLLGLHDGLAEHGSTSMLESSFVFAQERHLVQAKLLSLSAKVLEHPGTLSGPEHFLLVLARSLTGLDGFRVFFPLPSL